MVVSVSLTFLVQAVPLNNMSAAATVTAATLVILKNVVRNVRLCTCWHGVFCFFRNIVVLSFTSQVVAL
jgi:hypothetical protein